MASTVSALPMTQIEAWPPLPLAEWEETRATLHMWTQMVGKVRLAKSPYVNHWWQVPLYVSARGLTTGAIPDQDDIFEIELDFIDQRLEIRTSRGTGRVLPLRPRTVAEFYRDLRQALDSLGIEVAIRPKPCEIPDPIPFDQDRLHGAYDAEAVRRFWRVLVSADAAFKEFRAGFIGKASPVHFFWGSFDLAVTRFSGRRAPARPGADALTREAYSHEVISCGFWPGSPGVSDAAFYAYAAPEPAGFRDGRVLPRQAAYSAALGEYLLPYDELRRSPSPKATLLDFCQSTYELGASLAHWDRDGLERHL